MSAVLRLVPHYPPVSPIVCAPWCTDVDGHADALFAEDQTCMGEWHTTDVVGGGEDGQLSVLAYRSNGQLPDVSVCIEVARSDDLHLTSSEARSIAASLTRVADEIDAHLHHIQPGHDLATPLVCGNE